jgi:hypothetical protein
LLLEFFLKSRVHEKTVVELVKIVRPSFRVRSGQTLDVDSSEEGVVWRQRLQIKEHKQAIEQCLSSVGIVVAKTLNQKKRIGTAWMIDKTIAVTSKHIIKSLVCETPISVVFGNNGQFMVIALLWIQFLL